MPFFDMFFSATDVNSAPSMKVMCMPTDYLCHGSEPTLGHCRCATGLYMMLHDALITCQIEIAFESHVITFKGLVELSSLVSEKYPSHL